MTRRTLWCDHCNAHMPLNGVLSCLRKTCQIKDRVPPEDRRSRQ